MQRVLLDTAPLVALTVAEDPHHKECLEAARILTGPLFSCWAVITEAAWLLRDYPFAISKVLTGITSGFVEILPLQSKEAVRISEVMEKYSNLRPQLADATLVYRAEREGLDTIFTLDRRDFSVYRTSKNRAFRIIPDILNG
jgi:predicted nucleic acid-binding protein